MKKEIVKKIPEKKVIKEIIVPPCSVFDIYFMNCSKDSAEECRLTSSLSFFITLAASTSSKLSVSVMHL